MTTTNQPAGLTAQDLTLWRGTLCLFEALSFAVMPGQLLLIRGPNGAGKTTLLRVLSGLTRPEQGRIEWNGQSIEKQRTEYGAQLAWFGHVNGLKNDLTVRQNLDFFAALYSTPSLRIAELLQALALDPCATLEVRYLSAGQKRRTALARILLSGATLWLLDEPLTNLDATGREYFLRCLTSHLDAGGLAIAATHQDMPVTGIATDTLVLGDNA